MTALKCLLISSLLILCESSAQSQQVTTDLKPPSPHAPLNTQDDYQLELVKHFLQIKTPSTVKHYPITRMGDKVSELLIKIMGTQGSAPWSPDNTSAALDLVALAFEKPDQITNVFDHELAATNILFQLLDASTQDTSLKEKIQKTRQSLLMTLAQ